VSDETSGTIIVAVSAITARYLTAARRFFMVANLNECAINSLYMALRDSFDIFDQSLPGSIAQAAEQ